MPETRTYTVPLKKLEFKLMAMFSPWVKLDLLKPMELVTLGGKGLMLTVLMIPDNDTLRDWGVVWTTPSKPTGTWMSAVPSDPTKVLFTAWLP